MSSPVEQIKEKLSIVDVVGSYLKLEKAGANFKAKCPFHNEKTASFFISPERGSYYCFGCNAKGDIFSFVEQFEGLDFVGALRVLADRAGVELRRENVGDRSRERSERERLYLVMEYATLFYQRQLVGRADVQEYLTKRGLNAATIKDWRLGYAPSGWRTLADYLKSKQVTDVEMEKAGLVKKAERNDQRNDGRSDTVASGAPRYYDRFRGRVMFPIFDAAGRVIAFSGRQFESDGTEAKYINSPETPLFEKSKVLYGWNKAKLEIRKRGQAVLVEGQMDLLACHQAGIENAVATSGTALTPEHVTLIKRLVERLVICYDADTAGAAASRRGFAVALAAGMDVTIATFPAGQDPADIASGAASAAEGAKALVTFISNARHIIDVDLERIMARGLSVHQRDTVVETELLPYVAALESEIQKGRFISTISHKTGIKEQFLWDEVKKLERKNKAQPHSSPNIPVVSGAGPATSAISRKFSRLENIERLLWALILWLEQDGTHTALALDIRQKMSIIVGVTSFEERQKAVASGASRDALLFQAETVFAPVSSGTVEAASLSKQAGELLAHFEAEWLNEQRAVVTRKIKDAEASKDARTVDELSKVHHELSRRLSALH
jgi:DNA primase